MSELILFRGAAYVGCAGSNCQRTCEVEIAEPTPAGELNEAATLAAEVEHGWGSHGFCPTCERKLARDRAEDAARREGKIA